MRFTPLEPLCGLSTASGLWATCIIERDGVAPMHQGEEMSVFARVERVPWHSRQTIRGRMR